MAWFFPDYPLIFSLWYDENNKRKIFDYNIKSIDDIFTILNNLGLILTNEEVNSINNNIPLILNNTIIRWGFYFNRPELVMEKYNIGMRIYKNNTTQYDGYRREYQNDGYIDLDIETFRQISDSIVEFKTERLCFYKTNDISKIVIFERIENYIGFKLKNDCFLNRDILNDRIIKMSLDNEHRAAGIYLSPHDFDDKILTKYFNVNIYIYCCPYIPPQIANDFNDIEIQEIIREDKLSKRREEQSKYPWKTLEDISYPEFHLRANGLDFSAGKEFDRKPEFPTYSEQLLNENDLIQLKRVMIPKWEEWNKTQFAYKLPSELTLVIKDILVG